MLREHSQYFEQNQLHSVLAADHLSQIMMRQSADMSNIELTWND